MNVFNWRRMSRMDQTESVRFLHLIVKIHVLFKIIANEEWNFNKSVIAFQIRIYYWTNDIHILIRTDIWFNVIYQGMNHKKWRAFLKKLCLNDKASYTQKIGGDSVADYRISFLDPKQAENLWLASRDDVTKRNFDCHSN